MDPCLDDQARAWETMFWPWKRNGWVARPSPTFVARLWPPTPPPFPPRSVRTQQYRQIVFDDASLFFFPFLGDSWPGRRERCIGAFARAHYITSSRTAHTQTQSSTQARGSVCFSHAPHLCGRRFHGARHIWSLTFWRGGLVGLVVGAWARCMGLVCTY